jgi:uncharacterized membrane protein YjjP (DUF1212 family)
MRERAQQDDPIQAATSLSNGAAPGGARDAAAPRRQGRSRTLRRARAVLALAMQAGEIMLRSGAETTRVEETVNILVRGFGLAQSHCLVTPTGIYMSVDDPRLAHPVTLVHRVPGRTTHYQRITAINDLSRRVQAGTLTLATAQHELDRIERAPDPYPLWLWLAGGGASAAGVAVLLGGDLFDLVSAFVGTVLVLLVVGALARSRIPAIFGDFAGAALASAIALGLVWGGVPIHAGLVIAGGIMMLVPGAALLSSVQDGISGNLLSSGARGLETMLKAAALASGVGLVLTGAVSLGLPVPTAPVGSAVWQIPIQVVAAGGAAACYALWYYIPRYAIITAGVGGALGWLAYLLLVRVGATPLVATAVAAFVVGLLSWWFARLQHAPGTLYVVPGILPLLPGVVIYQGMLDLAHNQSAAGLLELVHALFLGGALAAGVALSHSVAPAQWRGPRRPA